MLFTCELNGRDVPCHGKVLLDVAISYGSDGHGAECFHELTDCANLITPLTALLLKSTNTFSFTDKAFHKVIYFNN